MAQKFYLLNAANGAANLPSSEQGAGTPDVTWTNANSNKQLSPTATSSQATVTGTGNSNQQRKHFCQRWVSDALGAGTYGSGTWTVGIAANCGNASQAPFNAGQINVYFWRPGTGKVGTVYDVTGSTTRGGADPSGSGENTTYYTFTGSDVTIQDGDVLCVEIWDTWTGSSTASRTLTLYFGGTTEPTSDNVSATNCRSFVNAPANIPAAPAALAGDTTGTATPTGDLTVPPNGAYSDTPIAWGSTDDSGTSYPSASFDIQAGDLVVVVHTQGFGGTATPTATISDNKDGATGWNVKATKDGATQYGCVRIWAKTFATAQSSVIITIATGSTQKAIANCAYRVRSYNASDPYGTIPTPIDSGASSAVIGFSSMAVSAKSFVCGIFQRGNSGAAPSVVTSPAHTEDGSAQTVGGAGWSRAAHVTDPVASSGNIAVGYTTSDTYTLAAAIEIKAYTQQQAALEGATSGSAALVGALTTAILLAGACTGTATSTGILNAAALQGDITASATPTAAITTQIQLAAAATGTATPTAALTAGASVWVTSDSGHRFLRKQGEPWRIKGVAGWSCIAGLTTSEMDTYISGLTSRGINCVMTNLFEHYYTDTAPDAQGNIPPFTTTDQFDTLNSTYMTRALAWINKCADAGIVVLLDCLYMGNGGNTEGWWPTLTQSHNTQTICYDLGVELAGYLADRQNLILQFGGDYSMPSGSEGETRLHKIMEGMLATGCNHLVTFHGTNGTISVDQTNFAAAVTVNGAYDQSDALSDARDAWSSATKPAFFHEGRYENEDFAPAGTRVFIRSEYLAAVLGSIGGGIYGNNPQWECGPPTFSYPLLSTSDPFDTWQNSFDAPALLDIQLYNALLDLHPWWTLVPQGLSGMMTFLTAGGTTGAANTAGKLAIAYAKSTGTGTQDLTINKTVMSESFRARWWNPTDGSYTSIGTGIANTGNATWTTPGNNGTGTNDWILVLDVPIELAGGTTGTMSSSGADLTVPIFVAGGTTGAGTAAGDLTTQILCAGAATGTAAETATLTTQVLLAAAGTGTATPAGDLTTQILMAGAGSGTATVAGSLTTAILMAGGCSGTATPSATLTGAAAALEGALSGTATPTAALTIPIFLAGAGTGAGIPAGTLTTQVLLAGAGTATTTPTGAITTQVLLAGAGTGTATPTANLSTGGAAVLEGGCTGTATAAGDITTTILLAGAGTGTASSAGTLSTQVLLAGAGTATATPAAAITTQILLAGAGTGTASSSATLIVPVPLAGAATGTASSTGALTTLVLLAGAGTATATPAAALTIGVFLAGAGTGTGTASGQLTGAAANLGGAATATASPAANLSTGPFGNITATATPAASLTTLVKLAGGPQVAWWPTGRLFDLIEPPSSIVSGTPQPKSGVRGTHQPHRGTPPD